MKFPLEKIETRLQNLIEGSLAALLPWGGRHNPIAGQLVKALQENVRELDGVRWVPGNYLFFVSPSQMEFWAAHPAEVEGLSFLLSQAGREAGYRFESEPRVILVEDASLLEGDVRFSAQPHEETGKTAVMEVTHEEAEEIPANAFLIVNGTRVVPLRQSVINIGRREENHLVTDDPRVSRSHAQLRAVHGVFYLFDLNSTGGTFVNGERITRTALKPGDVISLAGFPIIYGQDTIQSPPASPQQGGLLSGTTDPLRPDLRGTE